ncbi:MAG: HAMP domain-containing histidine kinase [Clostridia bacterium]|nr:HAMP domain-containing histidine kinase [Clostridia bacterium]
MIKKLKIKFIALSMISLFALLSIVIAGMNISNYISLVKEADAVLSLLSKNRGSFPGMNDEHAIPDMMPGDRFDILPPDMSPELPYESRYFSVLFDGNGEIVYVDTNRIVAVDQKTAAKYAKSVQRSEKTEGFEGDFRYIKTQEGENIRITFLDCGRKLDDLRSFLITSIASALIGYIAVFAIVCLLAERIIRPVSEAYEKQKRFITDAGHEIKTPLTIINANLDILEMENIEHECLDEIKNQTGNLRSLTNGLVSLAKLEEMKDSLPMIDFPVSDVVFETVSSFKALAKNREKSIECEIEPFLSMRGNGEYIGKLVSLLTDNALKYSPVGTRIDISFKKVGRSLVLEVTNKVLEIMDKHELSLLFERFYRSDKSRNSKTGGYGIGLSTARAIVNAHSGRIFASMQNSDTLKITAVFPSK